jgi:NAD-dependent deacetylase
VWFGEMPYHMERIATALARADLFAAIGTSGQVYPAAGFVREACQHGAETIQINACGTSISLDFHHHLTGPSTIEVPRWVESLLACPQ